MSDTMLRPFIFKVSVLAKLTYRLLSYIHMNMKINDNI